MADWNKPLPIGQLKPGMMIIDWDKINTPEKYKALDDILTPRRPGESVHLSEEDDSAQSLKDMMRLRMQLPR